MVVPAADGCGGGRYRGPGGACHWYGRGPYPGGYYGSIADHTGLMEDPDPGTAAAMAGIAVQAGPVIRLGEARTRAGITAPIDTDRPVENLRAGALPRRSLVGSAGVGEDENPAWISLFLRPISMRDGAAERHRGFSRALVHGVGAMTA
jgi:hypothetical protein